MQPQPWTWNSEEHPQVAVVLASPPHNLTWCDRLEAAPKELVVGKVLCVCAASAIARRVLIKRREDNPRASDALDLLDLLDQWIDDPTSEGFDHISFFVFEDGLPECDQTDVVWWALRSATSAVGCQEAAWALEALCNAAAREGWSIEELHAVATQAVTSRKRLV
jgi:hypothetical protein